jgi:hypothetical protein
VPVRRSIPHSSLEENHRATTGKEVLSSIN